MSAKKKDGDLVLRCFFEFYHIRGARGRTKTTAHTEFFFYRSNGRHGRAERSKNGDLFFFDLYLYSARGACLAARTTAAASLFVNIGQRALLILLDKEFAECAQRLPLFPSAGSREAYEPRMISFSIPFGGRPPQLGL